ncbi:hypothetical protein EVAR_43484_1 [Eumeta japonica]|uniref:Uncharacterized protein n=1 Tax=Eumeta variegata TaxID=151549 RepID=A0A4C1YHL5_EUMVA|nr:hypothetical protein EVAR_43484_1 [Eumeta japonica]
MPRASPDDPSACVCGRVDVLGGVRGAKAFNYVRSCTTVSSASGRRANRFGHYSREHSTSKAGRYGGRSDGPRAERSLKNQSRDLHASGRNGRAP